MEPASFLLATGAVLICALSARLFVSSASAFSQKWAVWLPTVLVVTVCADVVAEDMRGTLVYGHEERTVRLCGDGRIYWMTAPADVRGQIAAGVGRLTSRPYEAVMLDFDGEIVDRPLPGLAGDVDGIIEIRAMHWISRDGANACDKAASKIRFDLGRLNGDGLQGPPDGLRALHYEYCAPDRPGVIARISEIDPSLQIQRGARGRAGCGEHELLCLGHTHQPGYREVLQRLSRLCFVREIREAFFE